MDILIYGCNDDDMLQILMNAVLAMEDVIIPVQTPGAHSSARVTHHTY